MHLGGSDLAHTHKGPWRQQRDKNERFRCGRVFHVAWLRLSKKVVRHSISQQPRQLLHRKPGLVRKVLKGCTRVEGNKGVNVVTKDCPKTDRSSKLTMSDLWQSPKGNSGLHSHILRRLLVWDLD